jgi:hypothetical protein
MLNRSKGRVQTKCNLWCSRLQVGVRLTASSSTTIYVKESKDTCQMGRLWEITYEILYRKRRGGGKCK